MKLESVNVSKERELVSLLIMSTEFCNAVLPLLNSRLLRVNYSKYVADYVREYWDVYHTAPQSAIQSIFHAKRGYIEDEDITISVATFLESISESFVESKYKDMDFYITNATTYLRELDLENLENKIHAKRITGKFDDAEKLIGEYKRLDLPKSQGVSLKNNLDIIAKAFDEDVSTPLFTLDGALGRISNFYRGDLSAMLSASKAGKSWWLNHVTMSALRAGCITLHINLEMREEELYQRFWRGLQYRPLYTGDFNIPRFIADREPKEDEDTCATYRIINKVIHREAVDFKDMDSIRTELNMRYSGGDVIFMSLPSYVTTVEDIEVIIKNLYLYQGIKIDVLNVDYADLLGSREREYRHKINDIWMNLRRVAQEHRIHVTTVSQSNAEGLDGKEINLSAIAEDKRKITHVSMLLGMWATDEERQKGYVYMKNLVSRYKIDLYDTVCVTSALDLGRFVVDSRPKSQLVF